jgi:hypothetical protein
MAKRMRPRALLAVTVWLALVMLAKLVGAM